jgi:hypothetical protein
LVRRTRARLCAYHLCLHTGLSEGVPSGRLGCYRRDVARGRLPPAPA